MHPNSLITPRFNFIHLLGLGWLSFSCWIICVTPYFFAGTNPLLHNLFLLGSFSTLIGYFFKRQWIKYIAGALLIFSIGICFLLFFQPIPGWQTDNIVVLFLVFYGASFGLLLLFISWLLLTFNVYLLVAYTRPKGQAIDFSTAVYRLRPLSKSWISNRISLTTLLGMAFLGLLIYHLHGIFLSNYLSTRSFDYNYTSIGVGLMLLVSAIGFFMKFKYAPHFSSLTILCWVFHILATDALSEVFNLIPFFILLSLTFITTFTIISIIFHPLTRGFLQYPYATEDDFEDVLDQEIYK